MKKKEEIFQQLEKNIKVCEKCRLFQSAKNAVPGEGNINSELVFIGEAPGQTEDETGRPFVGRAGMLLENTLKRIGYQRNEVWIGNIIKHRPPANRDPLPDEISACTPFLNMQLKLLNPILIVTLGRFALTYFYPDGKISRDRGRVIKTDKYFLYPVYHPAAALRNGNMMESYKNDFMKIPEIIKKIKEGEFGKKESNDPSFSDDEIDDGQLRLKF